MFGHHHHHPAQHRSHGCHPRHHGGPRSPREDEGPGRGFGEEGRRRRVFDAGELRLVLLTLLEEQPRHGYDLIREIEARSAMTYAPSPGMVYPTLTLLGDMGLVAEEASEGARKVLAITAEGRAHLEERRAEAQAAMARIEALARAGGQRSSAPVRRSMQNLKMALQQKLGEEGADRETGFAVAALIDEAVRKIERL